MLNQLKKPLIQIFILSLVIRVFVALPQQHPYNIDEAYHTINAITLAKGEGFVEHFIWNYLNPPLTVTHPGNLYWMPLNSLIAAASMVIGGQSYARGQWGFIILSALLPPFGYLMTWQITTKTRQAWLVALLLLFSGFYFPVWTVIDSFTPFSLAGALCLYATWHTINLQSSRWAIIAGLMAALAHLSRADGLLLLVAIGITLFVVSPQLSIKKSQLVGLFSLMVFAYGLFMLPWFIRNFQITGSPLPPGGSKTIWLQNYNQLFSYQQLLNPQTYLSWGWGPILQSKLWAVNINLQTLIAVQGLIVAFPLSIIGVWQKRRHLLFQLNVVYLILLFGVMSFVFTFPGPRGALFHSGGAILPVLFMAAIIGLDTSIAFIARRRHTWRAKSAQTIFGIGLIVFAIAISIFAYLPRLDQTQTKTDVIYPLLVKHLAAAQNTEKTTVMLANPPAFLYYGGYQAIIIPNESLEVVLEVADRYEATYLVLDANHPLPLAPYFNTTEPTAHPRLVWEATLIGPTYLYKIIEK